MANVVDLGRRKNRRCSDEEIDQQGVPMQIVDEWRSLCMERMKD